MTMLSYEGFWFTRDVAVSLDIILAQNRIQLLEQGQRSSEPHQYLLE